MPPGKRDARSHAWPGKSIRAHAPIHQSYCMGCLCAPICRRLLMSCIVSGDRCVRPPATIGLLPCVRARALGLRGWVIGSHVVVITTTILYGKLHCIERVTLGTRSKILDPKMVANITPVVGTVCSSLQHSWGFRCEPRRVKPTALVW